MNESVLIVGAGSGLSASLALVPAVVIIVLLCVRLWVPPVLSNVSSVAQVYLFPSMSSSGVKLQFYIFAANDALYHNKPRTKIPKSFFMLNNFLFHLRYIEYLILLK